MKKIRFLRIIKIIFAVIIFNIILLAIQYIPHIKVNSTISNMNEYTQDDKILKETGGLKRFPITLGNRLYLYDIKRDKWKLVRSSMIPYYGFGNVFILNKEKMYYNRFGEEEGIELYSKKTNGFGFEKEEIDQAGISTISSKYMYYLKESEEDTFTNHIYRKNMKTGKTEVYLKGQFSYVLRQDHGNLYTYNNKDKCIYEINLKDKTISKCKDNSGAEDNTTSFEWIGYVDKDKFMVIDGMNMYTFDKKKNKKTYYIKNLKNEDDFMNENVNMKKGKLYYSTQNLDVFELNLKTGQKKKICSESNRRKGSENTEVTFTKSYIVVDVMFHDYKKEKLYIHSYDGKLIREVNVVPAL